MSNESREALRRETALLRESARGGMLRRLGSGSQLPIEDSSREGGEGWLMTYLDLLTLLLVLFVLLVAFSAQGGDAYQQATRAMADATRLGEKSVDRIIEPIFVHPQPGAPVPLEVTQPGEPVFDELADSVLEGMQQDLLSQFADAGMETGVEVMLRQNQLDIQLSDQILFPSGEARLREEAYKVLVPIANVLRQQRYDLTVEGHTDNIPIATERFPSNWELSASRASYVVRFLIDEGIEPVRLRAVGYAETRPIADNASVEGRAKNRRVILIIHQQQDSP